MNYDPTSPFRNERKLCHCEGKPDIYILFSRVSKSIKRFYINNVQYGLMIKDSPYVPGDIIYDGENYHFLVAKRESYNADRGEFYKANCVVDIVRLVPKYIGNSQSGLEEVPIATNQISVFEDVSAQMHLYDAGLLESTVRRFLLPNSIPVKLLDRIKFRGENMQIDSINTSDFEPFLYVQCSQDMRPVK